MRTAMFVLVAGLAFPSVGTRADDKPKAWTFIGRTEAATVKVRARVTGHLTRLAVREGSAIAKGDLLAELDPRMYQLELEAAHARMKMAEARLQKAKLNAAGASRLVQSKAISQEELALHMAAAAEAEAALMVAKVEVERAGLILSWTRVTAPVSGRVSRIQSTEGSLVIAEQTQILTVVATEPLYVTFSVPESTLLQLRRDGLSDPGKVDVAVGFVIDKEFPRAAKLDSIEPELNPETAIVRFRATIPNPDGLLLPGMSARVSLTPRSK